MARWTASAKWAAGPALDGQRDMPLALRLSEWLGRSARKQNVFLFVTAFQPLVGDRCTFLLQTSFAHFDLASRKSMRRSSSQIGSPCRSSDLEDRSLARMCHRKVGHMGRCRVADFSLLSDVFGRRRRITKGVS